MRTADGADGLGALGRRGPRACRRVGFSPVAGDRRLLAVHERDGRPLPFVVDPDTGAGGRTPTSSALPGDLEADWYADGSRAARARARRAAARRCTGSSSTARDHRPRRRPSARSATPRPGPDGDVEFSWSSSAAADRRPLDDAARSCSTPPGEPAPPSVPVQDAFVDGPGGQVHALVAAPAGRRAVPDRVPACTAARPGTTATPSPPDRAAYVDLGCAVVHVNYRGSTGYGTRLARRAHRTGPGLTELEDVAAVHDWAVDSGLADPARTALAGGSWGGYLTLLGLGTQPERWACGVAAVPVADYLAAYEDEMEPLRAFDRSLFGGSPEEVPRALRALARR